MAHTANTDPYVFCVPAKTYSQFTYMELCCFLKHLICLILT